MGTRGFVGFVADGQEKIQYVHADAYPSGLGLSVLQWLRYEVRREADRRANAAAAGNPRPTSRLAVRARRLRVVSQDVPPAALDVERLRGAGGVGVDPRAACEWYFLLRYTQGDLGAVLDAGVVEDAHDFPRELGCRYGYLVDLDAGRFEAYAGLRGSKPDAGRWKDAKPVPDVAGRWPVRLVASWPLGALPGNGVFLSAFGDES